MIMTWIMLVAGLVLLVFGADLLVKGAARLASSFGVPALVIGLTVVAFGTSAPELAVSVKAAYAGQAELAIANVVGSNTFNILFILGIAASISPLIVSQQLIRQDVPIMILVSMVVVWMAWDSTLDKLECAFLFAGLFAYTAFIFVQGKKNGADVGEGEISEILEKETPLWQNLLLVVFGLVLLVLGARWLVQSAIEIASAFGVSEAVIGLTIVAAGTSLPEVMTSVIATIKGQRDIAIGNVVGSNIFNILCVLGLSGLVSPIPLIAGEQMINLDFPMMLATAILCLPLFFVGSKLIRFEGFLFLTIYVAYVWYMVAITISADYAPLLKNGIIFGLIPLVVVYALGILAKDLVKRNR
jgi:cation:H+ antiporter